MKWFAIACLFLYACKSSENQNGKSMEITNAFQQKWYGGAAGSGWGIDYTFKLVMNRDNKCQFDSVWIDSMVYEPVLLNKLPGDTLFLLKKGDTITVICKYYYREIGESGEIFESPSEKSTPPNYKGVALILFRANGVAYKLPVERLEVKEAIFYP